MKTSDENLDKILPDLFSKQDIKEFKDNLSFADKLFSSHPKVDSSTLDDINKAVLETAASNNSYTRIKFAKPTLAAAVVLVFISISAYFLFHNNNSSEYKTVITAQQWQSSNLAVDDEDFSKIENDFEIISAALLDYPQQDSFGLADELIELENNFIDLDENFWKG